VRARLFVFVWLSDDRRLAVFLFLVLLLVVFIIIVAIVWVSRRHHTGDVLQPIETVFENALDHVGTITPTDPLVPGNISAG
jgi:hypothetical protein